MKREEWIRGGILAGILLICAILYYPSFTAYFFQDDWFTLRIGQAQSVQDVLGFFLPRNDVIYYRPLGMQVFFFISRSLFGLNATAFHLFHFVTFSGSVLLAYLVAKKLTASWRVALITSFMYATSTIHFIPFYWLSTYPFTAGTALILFTFYTYLLWSEKRSPRLFLAYFVLLFLSFLMNETALLLPVLVVSHMFMIGKVRKPLVLGSVIMSGIYVLMRWMYVPALNDTYALSFGKQTIKALMAYVLWLFQWPEEMRNQLDNILTGNRAFFSFKYIREMAILSGMLMIFALGIVSTSLVTKTLKKKDLMFVSWLILAAVSGLALPLLFPHHTYPYYLNITALFLFMLLSWGLIRLAASRSYGFAVPVIGLFLALWLASAYVSLQFSIWHHWAPARAAISSLVTADVLQKKPAIADTEAVYLPDDDHLKIILSNQEAFQILYNNPRVSTVYNGTPAQVWKIADLENKDWVKERLELNTVQKKDE